ncbi:sensitivity to high expression protein she9 [Mortierella alpina]|nr:sensitivity to high expression protein she9 [Mortierella alpina]
MASHLRLIRPVGTLAAKGHSSQLLFPPSNLRLSVSNGCTVTPQGGPDKAILLAKRAFSTSLASNSNSNSNQSSSSSSSTGGSKDVAADKTKTTAVSASEAAEEEAKKKVVAEAEKKRIEAQDAALKEILESAAAEKRKLEQEAIKIAEEKARKAAAQEADAAAAKAHAAAKAKAEADAAAKAKLDAEKHTTVPEKSGHSQKQQHHQEHSQTSWSHSQAPGSSNVTSNSVAAANNKPSATDNWGAGARLSASSTSQQAPSASNGQANKEAGSQNSLGEDPLEPFKAKLLPYKRSLESSTEYIRSALPDSLRQISESMKRKDYRDTIALLAGHLNTFTGYNAINELKHKVITHGDRLDEARIKLVQAKQAYEDAIGMRSDTQKAINDLLQRKHLWSPDDVIRFTDLYRSEHANEQAEQKTKAQYKQAESEVEERSRQLTTVITERYHEEQVWSDKIRAASTYGTWGLIGVNVMAFLVVQAFVEPRRRRKQVERYEELVQDLTERGMLPHPSVSANAGSGTVGTAVAAPTVIAKQVEGDSSESVNTDATPVAVGGALLGGEDVLLKIIQSAERQEERLDRMEALLLKQIPLAQPNDDTTGSAGSFVVADDGSILFVPEDDDDSNSNHSDGLDSVGMAKGWREENRLGSRSEGISELDNIKPGRRLSQVLKDGNVEVPATRRDFLLSGLGGAIIGGLVTVVVMMNY